jgi:hypothetical protein
MTFKKKSGLISISGRVKMDYIQNKLSIVKQCRLLEIHCDGLHYKTKQERFRKLENNATT